MSRFRLSLFVIAALSFFPFANAVAQEESTTITTTTTPVTTTTTGTPVVEDHVIVTPVPAAKEVIATPSGYVDCFTVKGAFFGTVWVPEHRICQYENNPGKVAWVDSYWACTQYTIETGTCTKWEWKPGHWAQSLVAY